MDLSWWISVLLAREKLRDMTRLEIPIRSFQVADVLCNSFRCR